MTAGPDKDVPASSGPGGAVAREPEGDLAIRTLAMPADTNPFGDIFGGWLLSQMDIAGGIIAGQRADGRVATVAVEAMKFHKPVFVGDVLCCYGHVLRTGRTSIAVEVEAWVLRRGAGASRTLVTEGVFTYVSMGDDRQPKPVAPE